MPSDYNAKIQRLIDTLRTADGAVRLDKDTSNLFRDRQVTAAHRLDVRNFNQVLQVDPGNGWVEAEGMTPFAAAVDATLPHGVMPAVVPELKSITLGGAVSGVGIESSSFKYGLAHETVLAMDVLTGDGQVLTCTPANAHSDLFFGFPNSYGTLGYILKLTVRTVPIRPFVQLRHSRYHDVEAFFAELNQSRAEAEFLDGVVFGPNELYLTIGTFTDEAPFVSDYTFEQIYYRSIREKSVDYLTIHDYIWRWDTDWFWCSKNLLAQHPLVRRLLGKERLNSVTYTKIMRWNSRWQLTRKLNKLLGRHSEGVIQDVDIPLANAAKFLDFFQREIGITPIWICPIHAADERVRFDLYPLDPQTVYINFGFWDRIGTRQQHPPGYFNRKIEHKVTELDGIKSLYSDSFFSPDEFWQIYDKARYDQLKAKYDPHGVFGDLYQKTVLRT